eukprot:752030-Hanusia_phi.AAC.7
MVVASCPSPTCLEERTCLSYVNHYLLVRPITSPLLHCSHPVMQEAKPSWLKLAALECLHEYTTSDDLPIRLKKIHIISNELNQSSDMDNVIDMEMDAFAAIVSSYLDPPHAQGLQPARFFGNDQY